MEVSDEDVRKFTKVVFGRAFNLGCFLEDTTKRDKAYNLFLRDIENNAAPERIKKLIKKINT
tara:strand:+ start:359 stop:544 length:186 start_codon:yes stop_codon:yes gene_type:complete